jgi:hypothetical protein
MASTFGTLLSSQGADAHPSRSSDPSGGNFSTLAVPTQGVKPPGPAHTTAATEAATRGCGCRPGGDRPAELFVPPLRGGFLRYATTTLRGKLALGGLGHSDHRASRAPGSRPGIVKGPPRRGAAPSRKGCSAATYSPTQSPVQYHRR